METSDVAAAQPLTTAGWILMIFSLTFVSSLVVWCYSRVLSKNQAPAKHVKDFHSA